MTDQYAKATELGRQADAAKSDDDALQLYLEAWSVVPEPRFRWEGGTWIWNCIADIYIKKKSYSDALKAAENASKSHRGDEDSDTEMLLGIIYLDGYQDLSAARVHFERAWVLSEGRAFEGQPKRYRDVLKGKSYPEISERITSSEHDGHELPHIVAQRIDDLSTKGNEAFDEGRNVEALRAYEMALSLLPEPADKWEAFTWLQTAIGDVFFSVQEWAKAERAFQEVLKNSGDLGNPFIHLRIGQCAYEMANNSKAIDHLMRAYMAEGEEIFAEDRKYLDFLRANVRL